MKYNISFFIILLLMVYIYSSDYFPLSVGNVWVYNILDTNGNEIREDSFYIENDTVIDGTELFIECSNSPDLISSPCGYLYNSEDTIYNYNTRDSILVRRARKTYVDGDIWLDTLKVQYVDTVTVPAGTFNSCYYVPRGVKTGDIYAPDVGRIKSIHFGKTYALLSNYVIFNINIHKNINKNFIKNTFNIYPNPFNPTTSISYNLGTNRTGTLQIFDLRGRLAYSRPIQGSGTLTWDASGLGSGVYLLKALSAGQTYSRKLILQR